jgi:hypothetical protein
MILIVPAKSVWANIKGIYCSLQAVSACCQNGALLTSTFSEQFSSASTSPHKKIP